MSPEQRAAIGRGQSLAWAAPEVRARRSAAIRAAWDDPLRRALMSEQKKCRHGDENRHDDGACRICRREAQRRWYWRHHG